MSVGGDREGWGGEESGIKWDGSQEQNENVRK